ncbi:hypothetical protein [Oceanihabitans sediminis]|uniref:hypothetical protein n=1 Tax=Oceanihabitans sediminis TaxID=1812012 RepID=UPI00299DC71F|nr:hypothetical protein [Oceanihabitans sediminis]MDX1279017.1 hypothetical protein [Oceanihabitans sediminis]
MRKTMMVLMALFLMLMTACNFEPEKPAKEYEFPLNTTSGSKLFSLDVMEMECNRTDWEFQTSIRDNAEPDEYGYYGSRGTSIIDGKSEIVGYMDFAECIITLERDENGLPLSGTFAFRLQFDPNNGWIRTQSCNWDYLPDDCPVDENGNYINIRGLPSSDNPDYEAYLALQ